MQQHVLSALASRDQQTLNPKPSAVGRDEWGLVGVTGGPMDEAGQEGETSAQEMVQIQMEELAEFLSMRVLQWPEAARKLAEDKGVGLPLLLLMPRPDVPPPIEVSIDTQNSRGGGMDPAANTTSGEACGQLEPVRVGGNGEGGESAGKGTSDREEVLVEDTVKEGNQRQAHDERRQWELEHGGPVRWGEGVESEGPTVHELLSTLALADHQQLGGRDDWALRLLDRVAKDGVQVVEAMRLWGPRGNARGDTRSNVDGDTRDYQAALQAELMALARAALGEPEVTVAQGRSEEQSRDGRGEEEGTAGVWQEDIGHSPSLFPQQVDCSDASTQPSDAPVRPSSSTASSVWHWGSARLSNAMQSFHQATVRDVGEQAHSAVSLQSQSLTSTLQGMHSAAVECGQSALTPDSLLASLGLHSETGQNGGGVVDEKPSSSKQGIGEECSSSGGSRTSAQDTDRSSGMGGGNRTGTCQKEPSAGATSISSDGGHSFSLILTAARLPGVSVLPFSSANGEFPDLPANRLRDLVTAQDGHFFAVCPAEFNADLLAARLECMFPEGVAACLQLGYPLPPFPSPAAADGDSASALSEDKRVRAGGGEAVSGGGSWYGECREAEKSDGEWRGVLMPREPNANSFSSSPYPSSLSSAASTPSSLSSGSEDDFIVAGSWEEEDGSFGDEDGDDNDMTMMSSRGWASGLCFVPAAGEL